MIASTILLSCLTAAPLEERDQSKWTLLNDAHPAIVAALKNPKCSLPQLNQVLRFTDEGILAWDSTGKPDSDYASFVKVVLRSSEQLTLPFVPGEKNFILIFSNKRYGYSDLEEGSRWQVSMVDHGSGGLGNLASRLTPRNSETDLSAILLTDSRSKSRPMVRVSISKNMRFERLITAGDLVGSERMGAEVLEVRTPTQDETTNFKADWVRTAEEARSVIILRPLDPRTSLYLRLSPAGKEGRNKVAQVDSKGKLTFVDQSPANQQNLWRNAPTFVQSWTDNNAAALNEKRYKFVSNLAISELREITVDVSADGTLTFDNFKPPK